MEVSGQLHVPVALPSRKEHPIPVDRRLIGLQDQSGRCGIETNLLTLLGIKLQL
jgi:hypothetical protein